MAKFCWDHPPRDLTSIQRPYLGRGERAGSGSTEVVIARKATASGETPAITGLFRPLSRVSTKQLIERAKEGWIEAERELEMRGIIVIE